MGQRDQWDTYWGAKKIIFLIRDIDGPTMTAAPMESCRFVARRSPWGRFGSAVVACKRLHRTRHRLQHILANSLSRQRSFSKFRAGLGSETSRHLHRWRKRCRRLRTTRPMPGQRKSPGTARTARTARTAVLNKVRHHKHTSIEAKDTCVGASDGPGPVPSGPGVDSP